MSNKQNTNTKKNGDKTVSTRRKRQNKSNKVSGKTVTVPVSRTHVAVSRPMKAQTSANGESFRVIKSELVGNIPSPGSTAFALMMRLRGNPASEKTFKTLPSIARNFEFFRWRKLNFRYENRCGSTDRGSVIMSPDYDASDSDAQANNEALLYENKSTKDFSIWKNQTLVCSPASMNRLFKNHACCTDSRFETTKQDQKTLDPVQIFIALDGVTASLVPGKLFVDYDIEFFNPQAPSEPVANGGQVYDLNIITANANSSSTTPIGSGAVSGITRIDESTPVFASDGSFSLTYPTAVLAKLNRDYSGLINTVLVGTGLLNNSEVWISDNPNTPAGSPGDIQQAVIDNIQDYMSGGLKSVFSNKLIGREGQYVKWKSPTFSTLSKINLQTAGTTVF